MKLHQLMKLSEHIDGPLEGDEGYDVYGPKHDVVLILTDDIEGARHMIECFSIQQMPDDADCMHLVVDVADQAEPFTFNLNEDGELVVELNIAIYRLSHT